jgi:hypothetical protein
MPFSATNLGLSLYSICSLKFAIVNLQCNLSRLQCGCLGITEHQVEILHRGARCAFYQVI